MTPQTTIPSPEEETVEAAGDEPARLRREILTHFLSCPGPQSRVCIATALCQDLLSGVHLHLRLLREQGVIELHHVERSCEFYVLREGAAE